MNSQEYLDMMKGFQEKILNMLEEEVNQEEKYQILESSFNDTKISDNQYELLSLLYLISKITNNHKRPPTFFKQIERILLNFKEDIKKYYSNIDIFNIFKRNKRILLFLFEQQIIILDEYIAKKIVTKYTNYNYPQYFQPEILPFKNKKWFPKYDPKDYYKRNKKLHDDLNNDLPENFYEKRKIGENDSQISVLIRNDMIKEFIIYVNKNNIQLDTQIQQSIFETNSFLLKNKSTSLIEYALFYGSIQILTYLRNERIELQPSMWPYAIHSKNSEIIMLFIDNHIYPKKFISEKFQYYECYFESIKCHHNDITEYFLDNYMPNEEEFYLDYEEQLLQKTYLKMIKYYNFCFMKKENINESFLGYFCKYNYYSLVYNLLAEDEIDINMQTIQNSIIIRSSKSKYSMIFKVKIFNDI